MHAETKVKRIKRAISWLCGKFNWNAMTEAVQLRLMALNQIPMGKSQFSPVELLHAINLGHIGLPLLPSKLNRATEEREALLDRLRVAQWESPRNNTGKCPPGDFGDTYSRTREGRENLRGPGQPRDNRQVQTQRKTKTRRGRLVPSISRHKARKKMETGTSSWESATT